MKELTLMLIPTPGAKPEFLAKLTVVNPSPAAVKIWQGTESLSDTLILEGYSKDAWAWKPNNLVNLAVKSTDGRSKLPGFIKYLKDRKKCAFGRFGSTGAIVISYVQKSHDDPNRMEARMTLDFTKVSECNLQPKRTKPAAVAAPKPAVAPRKQGGFLGKLVGAQQRTNRHVALATAKKPAATTRTVTENGTVAVAVPTKTFQEVMAEFRQQCSDKMLDFDLSSEETLKVPIEMAKVTAGLSDEDKGKVTMDVLKYMVYEAAEEVNEEWIAQKESSGFLDETIIAVYKEGAAPPEVLEELNQGEMPEEVLGQQRALAQERQRLVSQADAKHKSKLERAAHAQTEEAGDVSTLNTKKRDRRSIEDYERDKKQRT